MATPANQLDQILSTTWQNQRPGLADQITKRSSILAALESKSRVDIDGGTEIRQSLMHALNDTVGFYAGYDLFNTTPQGGFGHAIYDWKNLHGTVVISGDELRKNNGKHAFIGLVDSKFVQLRKSLIKKVTDAFWATSPAATDFLSIPVIVGNTGTLGGIDSSTETWWKSVVNANAVSLATTAGVKSLNNMFNSLWIEGSSPDFEFTTQANFESYEQLAVPQVRFKQTQMMDLGFEVIAHKTAEVIFEPGVPTNYWYFLNSENLMFFQYSGNWLRKMDTQRPYNQDAYVTPIICVGNLATDMRRAHGVLTNVT